MLYNSFSQYLFDLNNSWNHLPGLSQKDKKVNIENDVL